MAEKPKFVLFYMNNDKFCDSFIKKLKGKKELMKKMNLVDINQVPAYPEEVDMVPCIYDGKQLYKGAGAFKWMDDIGMDYLEPADTGLMYSFLDGNEEEVFNGYSLLDQKNGSHGMGGGGGTGGNTGDPTRMQVINEEPKNVSMESLMASRNMDYNDSNSSKPNLNRN